MALITRLSRLFQADMHAVLDKIEEPELLLKQAIREMEESITTDERQIRCWEYELNCQLTLKVLSTIGLNSNDYHKTTNARRWPILQNWLI